MKFRPNCVIDESLVLHGAKIAKTYTHTDTQRELQFLHLSRFGFSTVFEYHIIIPPARERARERGKRISAKAQLAIVYTCTSLHSASIMSN